MKAADDEFDAIVIGAGAGGGVAAGVLAEAGRQVLLLDRGAALGVAQVPRDHLRNHRLSQYGYNTERDLSGRPRVAVSIGGDEKIVAPQQWAYGYNASVVGGGTLVYGAQAWRFLPNDFRMASLYGTPNGSSLADWPIDYDTLEPFYDRVEYEMGVAGSPHAAGGFRRRGYPMPPIGENASGRTLAAGAEKLGWPTAPVPVLINSVPYGGRAACFHCGMCVGFACPVDAKVGSQNTMIPRAMSTGRCTLITHATAESLLADTRGKIVGVRYITGGGRHDARANVVVLAAGAVESARLLLNSRTDREPHGVGNNSDQVGRHLQGHYYAGALGRFKDIVQDCIGPGVSISTLRFNHGNPGVIGGGLLANEFVKLPVLFQKHCWKAGVPRWGRAAKDFMRESYQRTLHVQGPIQEIPSAEGRVSLDPNVRDRFGLPVARLSGSQHPASVRTAQFLSERAEEWLLASGATHTERICPPLHLSSGQHQAGTCRMGNDPATSVTDQYCCVHGHDNVFVADGSVHVTNGGFNPVLTILALAWRTATSIANRC